MTHICLNFLPFAHHPFRFLLKDVLTYGQEEIRIKSPTLQFVDLLHHLTYNSCAAQVSFLPLTLLPPLSFLFCSRSTSSISYTLISKVSVVAVTARRFEGAGGPSGPSTQHAPGLEEEEEEDVMACLEERWEGDDEEESKVSAGIKRRRWRPKRTNKKKITERLLHTDDRNSEVLS